MWKDHFLRNPEHVLTASLQNTAEYCKPRFHNLNISTILFPPSLGVAPQTCNAQFSYFDPPTPQDTPSEFFLFKKFEQVDLFQDSRSLASCIFHFTFVKRWQSDKWILYITVVNYGYLVSSDKPVTPVIQMVNFGLAGIKMHNVDGFEVVTSSNMWLSMVAGTTLAILLYCAGATASIVYALYNAPTFYKECFYDVSIYCYLYIDILRIYIVFLCIYILCMNIIPAYHISSFQFLLLFVCFHFASTKIIRLRCLTYFRRCHMLFTPSGPRISQTMEIPFPFCATINILVDYCFDGEGALRVGIARACNRQPVKDLDWQSPSLSGLLQSVCRKSPSEMLLFPVPRHLSTCLLDKTLK